MTAITPVGVMAHHIQVLEKSVLGDQANGDCDANRVGFAMALTDAMTPLRCQRAADGRD